MPDSQLPSNPEAGDTLNHAFQLCRQQYEQPHSEAVTLRIQQWREQSLQHELAWQQALAWWQASAEVSRPPGEDSWLSRCLLSAQVKREQFAEYWQSRTVRWFAMPAMACSVLLLGLLAILEPWSLSREHVTSSAKPASVAVSAIRYRSPARSTRQLSLTDGSVLQLNWNSKILVRLGPDKRHIELLQGEVSFKVKSDPLRPFVVTASGVEAIAIGTEYTVRKLSNREVSVTVQEGLVDVAANGASQRLTENQQIQGDAKRLGKVSAVNAANAQAWSQGLLVFNGQPLQQVLRELDRYSKDRLELGLIHEPDRPVTGTYFIDRADDAIALIALAFNLELKAQGEGNMLLKSSAPKRPN